MFKRGMLPSKDGIVPVNRLLSRCKRISLVSALRSGIDPLNSFVPRSSTRRLVRADRTGITSLSLLVESGSLVTVLSPAAVTPYQVEIGFTSPQDLVQ